MILREREREREREKEREVYSFNFWYSIYFIDWLFGVLHRIGNVSAIDFETIW